MREDDLIGQTLRNVYVIKARLGEGGMGRVYLATNAELEEKRYAVKVLKREFTHNPDFAQHFYDEARHQAQIAHPNVVPMVDYFHVNDDYFLVQEYVDGQSLGELIASLGGKGLPEKRALAIAKGMLAGLDRAHRLAIVHRDVKPSNVLVDHDGLARIIDFGIATQVGSKVRQKERLIGTPAYMSPEQLRDSSTVDHRSDVYSAGVVLFEALTGRLPFAGDTFDAVAAQQIAHPAPDPRDVNPKIRKRVAEMVRRAMRNDPDERFQGCAQFLKAIEKLDSDAWKYMLVSACVLATLSIYLVKAMYVDRQAIRNVMISATHSYNSFCRENNNRKNNSRYMGIAIAENFTDEIDLFRKRIADNDRNMVSFAYDYGSALRRLGDFNQFAVHKVFGEPAPGPQSRLVLTQTDADYGQFRETGQTPSPADMRHQCEALLWTPAANQQSPG